MSKCLYCYKELTEGEHDFHKTCSRKLFGTPVVPELPYINPEKPDVPLNKNDAFQKVQKRRVQEKR